MYQWFISLKNAECEQTAIHLSILVSLHIWVVFSVEFL